MKTITFQGVIGSYSHQALLNFLELNTELKLGPVQIEGKLISEEVMESVARGESLYGFLPVENSIVGNVSHNTELMFDHEVNLVAEHYFPIKHCLLGLPGSSLKDIKTVSSHPIALAQCRRFLAQHGITLRPEDDTAESARRVSTTNDPTHGAVASELCASLYNLEVLARHISHVEHNVTRFFLFNSREHKPVRTNHDKITLTFKTHHQPGALLRALEIFATHRVNLTKLESRPDPDNPFTYFFTVDFLGNLQNEGTQRLLQELETELLFMRMLGAYKQAYIPQSALSTRPS
jgi:prephenate dehydratase